MATKLLSCGEVFMGAHLNISGDSLDLADFDMAWGKRFLEADLAGEEPPLEQMREALAESVAAHLGEHDPAAGPWGWKHPHAYLLLPFLDRAIPDLRFVHFVRDGRRMAFSPNQRQAQHYGDVVFGPEHERWEPYVLSIEFWSWANTRAADYGEQHMGERYLRVRFEDICDEPERLCRQLIDFARGDRSATDAQVREAAALISRPAPPKPSSKRLAEVQARASAGLTRFGYM
ncbi:MAG TPA: sulfotransferase [Solirubrobacteraceae bacterium]|nr:sulfotransferase [Solirubrobacteraceae bacterium]